MIPQSFLNTMLRLKSHFHNDCHMPLNEDLTTVVQIKGGYFPHHVYPLIKTVSAHLCNCENFIIQITSYFIDMIVIVQCVEYDIFQIWSINGTLAQQIQQISVILKSVSDCHSFVSCYSKCCLWAVLDTHTNAQSWAPNKTN